MIVACTVCSWSPNARAQSAGGREAAASQYVSPEAGITVAEAIARALAQEPLLRATRVDVDAARGGRLQAGLRPNPTVTFVQQVEPGGTDSQSRLEMEWPLDLFRKTGRVAVAEQEIKVAQQGASDRERLLAADVRMKYGEVVAAVRDLSVADELIAATTRQLELLRARVDQGSTPPIERNVVQVELRRLEADRLLQTGRVDRALLELKRLLGMKADALLQLRESLEQLVIGEMDEQLPPNATVAPTRPDVQEADARIRVAEAQIDRARREGRFDLSVFGSYMRMDAGFPQLGLNGHGDLTAIRNVFHYVSAGAVVTVPWGNRNQGAIAMAEAAKAGAEARLAAAQAAAESEMAAATARDRQARRALAVYTSGTRDLAQQNLDVVTQTYELGRATVFDVLAEQRRYLDLEHAYSSALREAYEARTAVRRARGDLR